MAVVEPIPGEPAALADVGGPAESVTENRALVVADYHAGIERSLRREGVEVQSHGPQRREHLLRLVGETDADRVVFLGDLGHAIGTPEDQEAEELAELFDALPVPMTLVRGNHDGGIAEKYDVPVTAPGGTRIGDVGFAHGHTWPSREVLAADTVCVGHEHPSVRLEDDVGGTRVERAWLRGSIDVTPFSEYYGEDLELNADLVVFPAFNNLSGGTWVNVDGQGFLAPFLPEACPDAEIYLMDGTRLGQYGRV